MAVFLSNVCTFNSCGIKFSSLSELIRHIEDHHLDVDAFDNTPILKPYTNCIPISYVLRIFSNQNDGNDLKANNNNENLIDSSSNPMMDNLHHHNFNHHGHHNNHHNHYVRKSINSPAASLSTTPTGSELDDDTGFESDSGQSSIDSWANADSQSATSNATNALTKFHQIMGSNVSSPTISIDGNLPNSGSMMNGQQQMMLNNSAKLLMNNGKNGDEKRIFHCNVPGCTKQYRTANSLSHHRKSAHGNILNNNHKDNSIVINGHQHYPLMTKTTLFDENNKKIYRCMCGKIYKTSHGLKSHQNTHHSFNIIHHNDNQQQQHQMHDSEMTASLLHGKTSDTQTSAEINSNLSSASNNNYGLQLSSIKAELSSSTPSSRKSSNSNKIITTNPNCTPMTTLSTVHHFNQNDLIPDQSCPPVSVNVEVTSEIPQPKSNFLAKSPQQQQQQPPPILSAPTLQQHLLSPVIPKN